MPARNELFWLALALVMAVVLLVVANAMFRNPPEPRNRLRSLLLVAGLAMLLPGGGCAHRPEPRPPLTPAASEPAPEWDNATWLPDPNLT